MIAWRKRIAEWQTVMAHKGVEVSVLALLRAILSGPVPADVWRDRMRICMRCPVYNRDLKACMQRHPLEPDRILGCGCYTPFKALTAAPYPRGCFARQITDHEGWPNYIFASWRAKFRAVWRFIRQ